MCEKGYNYNILATSNVLWLIYFLNVNEFVIFQNKLSLLINALFFLELKFKKLNTYQCFLPIFFKTIQTYQCRIMRDFARVNAEGVGKSKGFAFCNFTLHEHALQVLRQLNNNPSTFESNKVSMRQTFFFVSGQLNGRSSLFCSIVFNILTFSHSFASCIIYNLCDLRI